MINKSIEISEFSGFRLDEIKKRKPRRKSPKPTPTCKQVKCIYDISIQLGLMPKNVETKSQAMDEIQRLISIRDKEKNKHKLATNAEAVAYKTKLELIKLIITSKEIENNTKREVLAAIMKIVDSENDLMSLTIRFVEGDRFGFRW